MYKSIPKHQHQTANYSYNFVEPTTQAHTQNIENAWGQIKHNLPSYPMTRCNYMPLNIFWRKSRVPGGGLFMEFLKDTTLYLSTCVLQNTLFTSIYLILHTT